MKARRIRAINARKAIYAATEDPDFPVLPVGVKTGFPASNILVTEFNFTGFNEHRFCAPPLDGPETEVVEILRGFVSDDGSTLFGCSWTLPDCTEVIKMWKEGF